MEGCQRREVVAGEAEEEIHRVDRGVVAGEFRQTLAQEHRPGAVCCQTWQTLSCGDHREIGFLILSVRVELS